MSDTEDQNQSSGERLIFDLNATPDSSNESSNGLVGNLLVAQSGGPTAVINASIAGVIQEAGKHMDNIEEIYGGLNGVYGILRENLVDLNEEDVKNAYRMLINELKSHDPKLLKKPSLILLTKSDSILDETVKRPKKINQIKAMSISSLTGEGLDDAISEIVSLIV